MRFYKDKTKTIEDLKNAADIIDSEKAAKKDDLMIF